MKQDSVEIGTAIARPGELARGVLRVGLLFDSSTVDIPVVVINGARPGTNVWIQSGLHGNEYVGARAIHQLLSEINPAQVVGGLVVVPMGNILAFRSARRSAEQDGLDMNRVWPGSDVDDARSLSAHTEIAVNHLYQPMRQFADIVIDCHSGGWANKMANWIAYLDTGDEASRTAGQLAEASGLDVIWRRERDSFIKKVAGSLSDLLASEGIPCVVIEVGGEGRVDPEPLAAMTNALRNILGSTGVLRGMSTAKSQARHVAHGKWMRAKEGGMFRRSVELLQEVHEGDTVGLITDLHGDLLETISAPIEGIVIGIRTLAVVNSGEYIGNIAEQA